MPSFVVQVYKTIRDYKNGKYPSYKYKKTKPIYPLVVTLEDWHLFGENKLLKKKIEEKLQTEKIPLDWLSKMPFTICSAQEFEEMIQIVETRGIKNVIGKKLKDPEKSKWAMTNFLSSEYPEDVRRTKSLFLSDFDSIFPEELKKSNKS